MTSRAQVSAFLLLFKQAASAHGVDLVPRQDTKETQRFLGLTNKNIEEILLALSVTDFCEGPIPDRERGGELWVFGIPEDRYQIYIKLKVFTVEAESYAKCVSFHIAKHPLRFLFSEENEQLK